MLQKKHFWINDLIFKVKKKRSFQQAASYRAEMLWGFFQIDLFAFLWVDKKPALILSK